MNIRSAKPFYTACVFDTTQISLMNLWNLRPEPHLVSCRYLNALDTINFSGHFQRTVLRSSGELKHVLDFPHNRTSNSKIHSQPICGILE